MRKNLARLLGGGGSQLWSQLSWQPGSANVTYAGGQIRGIPAPREEAVAKLPDGATGVPDSSEGFSSRCDEDTCVSQSGMWSQTDVFLMTQGTGMALGSERCLLS